MKLYKLGLIVGRFQMLHIGHESMIRHALELCDRVVVYIGSAQEAKTEQNPFSYNVRLGMFDKVFSSEITAKKLLVRPLYDIGVGNNDIWGRYILGLFEAEFHKQPDLYVTGCEKERPSWFPDSIAPNMDELRMTRHNIDVSATKTRKLMADNNYEEWCKCVPYDLYDSYELLKVTLKNIKEK